MTYKAKHSLSELFNQTKTLTSDSDIINGNLSAVEFKKAASSDILLSLIDFEEAKTSKFSKPVLKKHVSTLLNPEGAAIGESIPPVYVKQDATFQKVEVQLSVTNETINDSGIDIMGSVLEQVGAMQAVQMHDQAIIGANGLAVGLIDSGNNYTEALKSDELRNDGILSITLSGVNGGFGSDAQGANDFIMGLIADVPSRYQPDIALFMSRDMWFSKLVPQFFSNTDANASRASMPLNYNGYPVVLLDSMPANVFFVGSMKAALLGVTLDGSEIVQSDDVSVKGSQVLYHTMRFAFVPLDNTALRCGILQ